MQTIAPTLLAQARENQLLSVKVRYCPLCRPADALVLLPGLEVAKPGLVVQPRVALLPSLKHQDVGELPSDSAFILLASASMHRFLKAVDLGKHDHGPRH